jgi:hypothetical protein
MLGTRWVGFTRRNQVKNIPIQKIADRNFGIADRKCVGIRNAQIPLMLKLRKDCRTKNLLLLKLGIKVCRIITERYRHLILYKRR